VYLENSGSITAITIPLFIFIILCLIFVSSSGPNENPKYINIWFDESLWNNIKNIYWWFCPLFLISWLAFFGLPEPGTYSAVTLSLYSLGMVIDTIIENIPKTTEVKIKRISFKVFIIILYTITFISINQCYHPGVVISLLIPTFSIIGIVIELIFKKGSKNQTHSSSICSMTIRRYSAETTSSRMGWSSSLKIIPFT
jgi:hypothetical protein